MTRGVARSARVGATVIAAAALAFLCYRSAFYSWLSATPERDARDWSGLIVQDAAISVGVLAVWCIVLRATRRPPSGTDAPAAAS